MSSLHSLILGSAACGINVYAAAPQTGGQAACIKSPCVQQRRAVTGFIHWHETSTAPFKDWSSFFNGGCTTLTYPEEMDRVSNHRLLKLGRFISWPQWYIYLPEAVTATWMAYVEGKRTMYHRMTTGRSWKYLPVCYKLELWYGLFAVY